MVLDTPGVVYARRTTTTIQAVQLSQTSHALFFITSAALLLLDFVVLAWAEKY